MAMGMAKKMMAQMGQGGSPMDAGGDEWLSGVKEKALAHLSYLERPKISGVDVIEAGIVDCSVLDGDLLACRRDHIPSRIGLTVLGLIPSCSAPSDSRQCNARAGP